MITTAEIAEMRAEALRIMPDTCTISRATEAEDEYGGHGETFVVIASAVPILVSPIANIVSSDVAGTGIVSAQFMLNFPEGTDVNVGDQVSVVGDPWPDVVVTRVLKPESWDILIQAEASHVD